MDTKELCRRCNGRPARGRRAVLAAGLAWASLLVSLPAGAQPEIRSLTGIIEGHEVGGMTIDMVGTIYAADFGDSVWRVTPEGKRRELASGMYGTAGNVVDNQGNLLQSSYYADAIIKVDRTGRATPFATRGLSRPAGLAIDKQTGTVYVANCRSNSIAKIASDGAVSPFATSKLFNCPYGTALDRAGNLYVVNFNDNKMMKIDRKGAVSLFATVSKKGLGHLCFKDNRFYVTAFSSHEIYEVTLERAVKRILGTGERAIVDGVGEDARLSFPYGIACHPWAPRLYVNEDVNAAGGALPRRSIIRVITLGGRGA